MNKIRRGLCRPRHTSAPLDNPANSDRCWIGSKTKREEMNGKQKTKKKTKIRIYYARAAYIFHGVVSFGFNGIETYPNQFRIVFKSHSVNEIRPFVDGTN